MSFFLVVMVILFLGLAVFMALAVVVHIEHHAGIREGEKVRKRLSSLEEEMRKCLHANSMALKSFINSLVNYLMAHSEEEHQAALKRLAKMVAFCGDNARLNHEVLQILCMTEQFKAEMNAKRISVPTLAEGKEQIMSEDALLSHVQNTANQLMETRNALACFLRTYFYPTKRNIDGQFLAGANLNSAPLSLASCKETILVGADLLLTTMVGAHLENTFLNSADMAGAVLSRVEFANTNLTNANLLGADFSFSDLTSAIVAKSNLDLAKNLPESWRYADFEGANGRDDELWDAVNEKFSATAH